MVYLTTKRANRTHQMTLDELLFKENDFGGYAADNISNGTTTRKVDSVNLTHQMRDCVDSMARRIKKLNEKWDELIQDNLEKHYCTFYVPKRDKGIGALIKQIKHAIGNKNTIKDVNAISRAVFEITTPHSTNENEKIIASAIKSITRKDELCVASKFRLALKDNFRRIDAPKGELKAALSEIRDWFESSRCELHHAAAYAYVKERSTYKAIERHQRNKSRWFGKYDLSNFFGSITVEFTMNMLSKVFPFSEIIRESEENEQALRNVISLAFLNGGLPQGTQVSPLLTNIIMLPIDFELSKKLRDGEKKNFIYTRYADDFLISARSGFNPKHVETLIKQVFYEFNAPLRLNDKKTRYGSSAGSNWNLGLMLNKDNKITIGHEKKRKFKAMLTSYVLDSVNGDPWSMQEVQELEGVRSYYNMIEPTETSRIINKIGTKYSVNIIDMIKKDMAVI